jgi:mannitol-1-phosphate 5-dehydrogenase
MTCTIIGAGRTGRGFIGRLLYESGVSFHYVESQASLVERLRQKNSYTVEFFGNTRKPVNIEGFSVQHVSDKNTIESIAYSDLVFVSV